MAAPVDAPDAAGEPGLESGFGWALALLFRCYVRTVDALLSSIPGGPRGYNVLAAVVHHPPRSQLALAGRLGIDRTVLTYLLDSLAGAGLVERQPDPADRRARLIVATTRGRRLLRRLEGQVRSAEDDMLAGLHPAERAAFRSQLLHIAERARAADPTATACDAAVDLRALDSADHLHATSSAERARDATASRRSAVDRSSSRPAV
jgi:DNA-binding MarR family transcriptional regulator